MQWCTVGLGAERRGPLNAYGRYAWHESLFAVAWLVAFGIGTAFAWSRAFQRYQSAMG